MGNYREQYERYYGSMKKHGAASYTRASSSYEGDNFQKINKKESIISRFIRKFIWQLSSSFILLILLFALRYAAMNGAGNEFYEVSKNTLDEDFDVNTAIMYLDVSDEGEVYKEKALDDIDKIKSYVSGERTLKEIIKEDYVQPASGKVKYINGDSKGIVISTEEDNIVSVYKGTVEEIRDEDENKCIVINHGNGTETYYGSLSQVNVEEGDAVDKGEIIGKCSDANFAGKKEVIFKFFYLGNEKNPSDVMNLSSLEGV